MFMPQDSIRKGSNTFNQIFILTWRVVKSIVVRNLSFYVSLLMSLAIITVCLFWPTTAYEVIMGDDLTLKEDLDFKASPLSEYNLMIGQIGSHKSSMTYADQISSLNTPNAKFCGLERECEEEIFRRTMPIANHDIYRNDFSNVFYAVYTRINKDNQAHLLLRIPYHHTYNQRNLIKVLMPFKLLLDASMLKTLNESKGLPEAYQKNIKYGIKIYNGLHNKEDKVVNPLTQFSAGVTGAHAYLGLTVMVIHMSSSMVFDKEMELRSLMSIMGMRRIPYIISYIFVYILVIVFLALYGTIIIVIEPRLITSSIRTFSTFFKIFVNYVVVGMLIMMQGFLITTFTRSVRIITFIVLLVQCLQMIVGMTVLKFHLEESTKDKNAQMDISLTNYIFPVIAFFNTQIELSTGISVSGTKAAPLKKIAFLFFMVVITLMVALYLDFIIDTGTGFSFPWHFPVSGIFRRCRKRVRKEPALSNISETQYADTFFRESVNEDLVRIRLLDVEKIFINNVCCRSTEVRAVQNLTIDLQEGMITAILGHNGAGKTTTFSILVGLIHASGGSMDIYGLDPNDPWDKGILNKMTSICMQKDILMANMTCYEHMRFFGVIKGLSSSKINSEINDLFQILEMGKEKHKKTNILSGGQLRKLCVAIALLGDPKLVILDEPTSGVDPISRRSIWNALKTYKNNRVLILSTHYMDEADILADWKAIMVKGQIVCYGTSMFLKKKFNLGYILNCSLQSDQGDVADLLSLIKLHAPSAEFQKRYGMEVTFKVLDEEIVNLCQFMSSASGIQILKTLKVLDYGISVTKLEEIFLKLGEVEVDDIEQEGDTIDNFKKTTLSGFSKLTKLSSKLTFNEDLNLTKISESTSKTHKDYLVLGFYQFWTFIRLNILLIIRSPAFAILRTVGPVAASALAAILFLFETKGDGVFEPTGKNLSMISSQWPPYIFYYFSKHQNSIDSKKMFQKDLLCIRRMYGTRFIFTNETNNINNIKGSTKLFITSWNVIDGFKLDFIYTTSLKESLYNMFWFQTLLQNCYFNRIMGINTENDIKYYIITDTWNIKWADAAHPSFTMLTAFVYLIALSVAFNLMNPVLSGDVVRDRILGNFAQMTLYGLNILSYWGSHFVIHFFHYVAILNIIVIFMCAADNYLFSDAEYILTFSLIYLFASVDTILAIYCISLSFRDIVAAEISLSFSIMIPMFLMSVLVFCPLQIMNMVHIIFVTFFPFLNPWITVMLIDFKTRQQRHYMYDSFNGDFKMSMTDLMQFQPVRNSFIIHTVHIIFLGGVFCGFNWYTFVFKQQLEIPSLFRLFRILKSNDRSSVSVSTTMEGFAMGAKMDLQLNKGLVDEILEEVNPEGNISAAVGDLTKIYRTVKSFIPREIETTVALSNINLVVNKGEVFGLLGPSGAGKTTAMNCISQLSKPSSGKIIIYDQSIKKFIHATEALSKNLIGLCPQNNPIWPNLTVREHLLLYGALRSIPRGARSTHCTNLIRLVHLKKYTNSLSESLSGGCKRRLSMAISFTGHPDLILLDEPSCGVDPKSRRNLWDTISSAIHNTDKGAVITSQFMEECEALCNRLGIIVNGRIMCIGSPQELKSKFGRGISVEIKIIPGENEELTHQIKSDLTQYLLDLYPRLLTVENFGERVTYRIPKSPDINFGSVFKVIHEAKQKFDIEDYAVSQPTLEQVYFDFAKYQTKDDLRYDVQVHWK